MSADDASRSKAGPTSLVKRLLLVQEAGLALVIVLIALLLGYFGGSKQKVDRIPVPAEAQVQVTTSSISATIDGRDRRFELADGWQLRDLGGGRSLIYRERQVNKFFDLDNLFLNLVFASFYAVMAVGVTAVIATGGIDLSIGSIYALAALFGAIFLRYDWSAGFPEPQVLGSSAFWWIAIVLGLIALAGPTARGKFAPKLGGERASMLRTVERIILGIGFVLLVLAFWKLTAAVRAAGAAQTERSTLPLAAAVPIGVGVCCLVAGAAGWLNGVMIVGLRVHPFIITLGTMAAYRGLVTLPTQAQSVGSFPEAFTLGFFKREIGGVYPIPVIIMILVLLGGMIVLSRTVFGRRIYAIGGNETAAHYAGIPVGRTKIWVYTLMGALAGLSAAIYLGYLGAWEPNAGFGYELKVIAAAVIGGASLSGGRGSALGAILGALLIQLIDNGMLILGIDQNYNQIVMGAAIILAVVLDQLNRRFLPQGR